MAMTHSIAKSLDRLRREPGGKGLLENVLLMSLVTFASTAGMGSLAIYVTSACSLVGKILARLIV